MKKLLLALLTFSVVTVFSQMNHHKECSHLKIKSFKQKKNFIPSGMSENFDVTYHNIHWEIDPAQHYIKGNVTSNIQALENNISKIYFDLSDNLTVDSVLNNSQKLTFSHNNNLIEITLTTILNKNDKSTFTVYYKGSPASGGFGTFETSLHNGVPILWTLSEPYGARDWWPCKQSLTDKIDSIDIYVNTPSLYKVGSNGKLMDESVNGDIRTTHWKHRHPIATYLVAIAVTNYVSFSDYAMVDETNSVEILNYVYPESLSSVEVQAEYTVDVMELLSEKFIPYPFWNEKYGHAQFGWGGGMEHQTMSFMGGFGQGLIAHELAHQWFGDYVTCGSWQDIWVNEGFAVFCENIVIENLDPDYWHDWLQYELDYILFAAESGSVFVDDTSNVGRIFDGALTYTKGGFIIHMLRHQLGDEIFFNGIKNMLTSASTKAGFARGSNVQEFLEMEGDTNLTAFFNDWYYGQGYPNYFINWDQNESQQVRITISQTTTHASVDFFEMDVPVLLKGSDNEIMVKLKHQSNGQVFTVNPGFVVESIEFDPDLKIIAPHPATITVGIGSEPENEDLVLSPNPATNKLRIQLINSTVVKNYNIFNITGKLIKSQNVDEDIFDLNINVSDLPTGIYYVQIKSEKEFFVKQFIKN